MITLEISPVLNEREVKKHGSFLFQNGFSWNFASRLLTKKVKSISFKHLETLCTLLHCTPNDILLWKPDEGQQPDKSQPLHQLTPHYRTLVSHGLKNLPIETLREIRKMIEEEVKKNL